MAALLRLILFLLPVAALIIFIRYRFTGDLTQEEREAEIEKLQKRLGMIGGVFVLVALGLYITTDTGEPGTCYISPRSVDGKIVPGHYVAEDDPECIEERSRKTPRVNGPSNG